MDMSTSVSVLDNQQNTVADALKNNIAKKADVSIATSRFSLYAYEAIKKQLDHIRALRFLYTSPSLISEDAFEPTVDALQGIPSERNKTLSLQQSLLARDLARTIRDKAQVRSQNIENPAASITCILNDTSHCAIMPGPEMTCEGIGLAPSNKPYMAQCLNGLMALPMTKMFDMQWGAGIDIKNKFVDRLVDISRDRSPREIYEYALWRMFEQDSTGKNIKDVGIANTKIYQSLYNFQRDAMISIIEKIEKYNGCILCDSVGLGKTFTALAVIKYYQSRNDNILVLCPKKLRDNWEIYLQNSAVNPLVEDRFNYKLLNHTDLTRFNGKSGDIDLATLRLDNFDLIVIDESHNFRTDSSEKENAKPTRYKRLLEALQSGCKTKILMLTATPVNIKLKDLQSQINFITEKNDDGLQNAGIESIKDVIRRSQRDFNEWMKLDDDKRNLTSFMENMNPDYFTLLETLTIARSRRQIEHFYDTNDVGKFPTREAPRNITPTSLMNNGQDVSLQDISDKLLTLKLAVYAELNYIKPECRNKPEYIKFFENKFSDVGRERTTIKLMRANYLKRLESHIQSFVESINRLKNLIEEKLKAIEEISSNNLIDSLYESLCSDGDLESEEFDDDELDELNNAPKTKVDPHDLDLLKWRPDLEDDLEILNQILDIVSSINAANDGKLAELLRLIEDKWTNPLNVVDGRPNRKIILFTAFSDTAKELYNELAPRFLERGIYTGLVTGTCSKSNLVLPKAAKAVLPCDRFSSVLTHFSPRSKSRQSILQNARADGENLPEIDVLIATDCVSEGQNLQDCDYCINYDIHWNPVRIIQRFGRIDRIGSKNTKIQLVNFWPMRNLDEYLNLSKRIKERSELMDQTATCEGSIIESNRSKQGDREFGFRGKQLETLKQRVVNPEEIDGSIPLTDINLSEWKTECMHFGDDAEHARALNRMPRGIFAAAPATHETPAGSALFVLKALSTDHRNAESPLFPYCPILIDKDGKILAQYRSPNKILSILRDTCATHTSIDPELLGDFAIATRKEADMAPYAALLQKAIEYAQGQSQVSAALSLFSKGGTSIGQAEATFELVCFVVFKEASC